MATGVGAFDAEAAALVLVAALADALLAAVVVAAALDAALLDVAALVLAAALLVLAALLAAALLALLAVAALAVLGAAEEAADVAAPLLDVAAVPPPPQAASDKPARVAPPTSVRNLRREVRSKEILSSTCTLLAAAVRQPSQTSGVEQARLAPASPLEAGARDAFNELALGQQEQHQDGCDGERRRRHQLVDLRPLLRDEV